MMRRILVDLFYGSIRPNEQEFSQNSCYGEAACAVIDTEQKLRALLQNEAQHAFEVHMSAQDDLVLLTAQEHFITGFRLGARMAAEVLVDGDSCLKVSDGWNVTAPFVPQGGGNGRRCAKWVRLRAGWIYLIVPEIAWNVVDLACTAPFVDAAALHCRWISGQTVYIAHATVIYLGHTVHERWRCPWTTEN